MKRVYLIGVRHALQVGYSFGYESVETDEYFNYIQDVVRDFGIKSIAEEMHSDTLLVRRGGREDFDKIFEITGIDQSELKAKLKEDRKRETITYEAVEELGLTCGYYDLSETEQSIYVSEEEKSEARELAWLSRIIEKGIYPALFIVGSCHLKSFSKKIEGKKMRVCVLRDFGGL